MKILNDKWFEVWYVPGENVLPAYLVVVAPKDESPSEIEVIDINKNHVLFRGDNYEDVFNWLTEDGFELVDRRVFYDYREPQI
jgi:hypothetical protein